MKLTQTNEARKTETAQRELIYFTLALRFVLSRISALNPGINTNHKNFIELVAEKDLLTRRIEDATLKLKGKALYADTVDTKHHSHVIVLTRGGSRRFNP